MDRTRVYKNIVNVAVDYMTRRDIPKMKALTIANKIAVEWTDKFYHDREISLVTIIEGVLSEQS